MSEPISPFDGHLTTDEIAVALDAGVSSLAAEKGRHLESCDSCRRLLAMHKEEDDRIRKLRPGQTEPGPECPEAGEVAKLAAGLVSAPEADRLLGHVSSCDSCGALFCAATEDFAADPRPGEAPAIAALRSASPFWQREFAKKLGAFSAPAGRPRPVALTPRWLAYAAAVLLCLGGGWWGYVQWSLRQPVQLIAAAYTEQRPFEFRIPGAGHGPVRARKSANGSSFSRPPGLLRAVERISEELKKTPDDSKWLSLRARAEMLEWDADAAVSTLARATDSNPDDPAILADLGMAHALRAESTGRAVDYGYAIEYLSRALKAKPDYREARFNRAIVYERMFVYGEALKDWEAYLKLDPSGEWADEARRHKSDIEKKLKAREEALGRISDDPALLLARLERGEAVDPERYMDTVVTKWLPRRSSSPLLERVLRELAALFSTRHQDRWLADVIASRPSNEGFDSLAAAVTANRHNRAWDALAKANNAVQHFGAAGNQAAALQASYEGLNALDRTFSNPRECVQQAMKLESEAAAKEYAWLRSQAAAEAGVCRTMAGDPSQAWEDHLRGLTVARQAGYPARVLRAEGYLAGSKAIAGDVVTVWNRGRDGLERFWDGPNPGAFGLMFYVVLRRAATSLDLPYAAKAFNSAQVASIAGSSFGLQEAIGRVQAAGLAAETGYPGESTQEYERARKIFAGLGKSPLVDEHRLYAEIARASADTALGHPEAALARLEPARETVLNIQSLSVQARFHRTAGDAYLRAGRWQQAEREFRSAIAVDTRHLASLTSVSDRSAALQTSSGAFGGIAEIEWTHKGDPAAAFETMEQLRSSTRGNRIDPPVLSRETLVSYADLPSGLAAWVLDNRGLRAVRLPATAAQVTASAKRLARLCSAPESPMHDIRAEARRLHEWLVQPVNEWLDESRTLVIIPDAATAGVVFPILLDARSQFLADRFATVVASSASDYWRGVSMGKVESTEHALIVANPLLGSEAARAFPPLRQAGQEGRAVAAHFRSATVLDGSGATVEALESHGPKMSLLHFAGHGLSNSGNGGLVLAPPKGSSLASDVLDAARLSRQEWSRCRLAVLTACSAGAGESQGPVNPESLVRGLLWAGVSRVVAGRWNVDAESSLVLMEHFYAALRAGCDAPEALRKAMGAVRARGAASSHPYFWAGFQTYGSR